MSLHHFNGRNRRGAEGLLFERGNAAHQKRGSLMPIRIHGLRAFAIAGGAATVVTLAACDKERTAEADTPVSEAEVSTELPETVISDNRL